MSKPSNSIIYRLYKFFLAFVTPQSLPNSAAERLKAYFSLAILFCLLALSIINLVFWLSINSLDEVSAFTCFGFAFLYLLGRFFSHHWAIRILILFLLALPYLTVLLTPEILDLITILSSGFFAVVLSSQFTGFRTTILVSFISAAMILSMSLILYSGDTAVTVSILLPSSTLFILLTINAYQHERNQALPSNIRAAYTVYDSYPEAVLVHQGEVIQYANPLAAKLFGYDRNDLIASRIEDLFEQDTSTKLHFRYLDGQMLVNYENIAIQQDNQRRKVQVTAINIQAEGKAATLMTLRPLADEDLDIINKLEDTLLEREEILRKVSELMSDYAYTLEVTDENQFHFSWLAGAFKKIIGLDEVEILALKTWDSLVHPDDLSFFRLRYKHLLKGETRNLEYRIIRPDTSICWVSDTAYPIFNRDESKVLRIMGVAQDISERVKAQEILRNHVVQQAIVAELGLLALTMTDPSHILNHAVILCEQVLEANLCLIYRHDSEQEILSCVSSSKNLQDLQLQESIPDAPSQSLMAYALYARDSVIVENLSTETRFQTNSKMLDAGYKSAMSVIILGQERPYGVLSIFSQKQQVFDNDEVYFVQAVANVLGTFIERNRAQAAEREEYEFAEALREASSIINSQLDLPEVLSKILEYLRQVVPAMETASIMLTNEQSKQYDFVSAWGFSDEVAEIILNQSVPQNSTPLISRMIDTAKSLIVNDVSKEPLWVHNNNVEIVNAYLGAPIIAKGACIGVLHVNSSQINAFNEKDAQHLLSFADKIGTAISNARRAEELESLVIQRTNELDKQREQLSSILESTGEGIFYTENNKIIFANQQLCRMTDYSLEQLIGADSSLLLPKDQSEEEKKAHQEMEDKLKLGETSRVSLRFIRQDGTSFLAGISSSPIGKHEDGIFRKVSIIRDISQEKELAELKNRFIASAAHDLRAPISSLKTRMYMIEKQPEKTAEHLQKLDQVINRMNRLVGDLMDTASFSHGKVSVRPETIILQPLLQQLVEIMQPEASQALLKLSLEMLEEPLQIWADSVRLEQVFTNLIINAINYTPQGEIKILTTKENNHARIVVSDTGLGIPEESLPMIFDAFYRVNPDDRKGNGLGLNISREIVEKHNGKIEVTSELGKGSSFTVYLPLLED